MTRSNRTPTRGIATTFNGVHFRSRLEARWAVTFALLNWEYEYEPMVRTIKPYLPDFWIGSLEAYAEVKPWRIGSHYTKPEWEALRGKIEAAQLDAPVILLGATYGCSWDGGYDADALSYGYEWKEPRKADLRLGWAPMRISQDKLGQTPFMRPFDWIATEPNKFLRAAWIEAGNKTRWRPRAA